MNIFLSILLVAFILFILLVKTKRRAVKQTSKIIEPITKAVFNQGGEAKRRTERKIKRKQGTLKVTSFSYRDKKPHRIAWTKAIK